MSFIPYVVEQTSRGERITAFYALYFTRNTVWNHYFMKNYLILLNSSENITR